MGGMSWRIGRRKSPPTVPDESEAQGPQEQVHSSPALEALVERLQRSAPPSILDLGPALGTNVEFFSRYAARLSIADFLGSLSTDEGLAIRFHEQPAAVVSEILSAATGAQDVHDSELHDVVLAWDVFNYLTRQQMDALGEHLARLTRPGAHLLTLVATAPEIPAEPVIYKIEDEGHLRYGIRSPRPRKSPRWAPAELGRCLASFTVDRSYLLRHGVQEYLMLRRES